ncbi:hypothetical protein LR032_05850 [Candidatus Bipolaricaulota bacterium]|nr:hypothetical protein [Candidatus Bipolaricaulota bacterium]
MPIWKIGEKGPTKLPKTNLKEEKLLEEHLEDWIVTDPPILGEPLLVIGRQVLIPDTKDRLDVLAVDPQGNACVIELKRGKLRDPVAVQALRYASYVSKWKFEDFENQARNFLGKVDDHDFNFNALYEAFCEDTGVDEIPTLNQDQRMIIVGSSVRDKLGTVALWLRDHSIDITVIEMQAYKEGDSVLLQPTTIVPFKVKRFANAGRLRPEGTPWVVDGKEGHLQKRCSAKTREVFEKLDKILQDNFEVDGPRWNQKDYVAYRVNNYNWVTVTTTPSSLRLHFFVKAGTLKADDLAKQLNIAKFDQEDSLSEKLNLPSSVIIKSRNEATERIILRLKEDFALESEAFTQFLSAAYRAFPK